MITEKAFSSIDLVGQCLTDKKRTLIFEDAIKSTVSGKKVLDAGTGSSVLAMLAAKHGASSITAIELDPYIAEVAENNIKINNFESKINILKKDVKKLEKDDIKDKIDVVLMEMITTGMIDEAQVDAVKNLKERGITNEQTIYIPDSQQSFLTFGFSEFKLYELRFPMITHLWDIHIKKDDYFKAYSDKIIYDDYKFSRDDRLFVDVELKTIAKENCNINSALLESKSIMHTGVEIEETSAINGKVLIPIEEKHFHKDQEIKIRLKYDYGKGFESLKIDWLT